MFSYFSNLIKAEETLVVITTVAAEDASQTSEKIETTTISDHEPETISATSSISLKTESITNGESSAKETQSEIKKVEVEADTKEQKGRI